MLFGTHITDLIRRPCQIYSTKTTEIKGQTQILRLYVQILIFFSIYCNSLFIPVPIYKSILWPFLYPIHIPLRVFILVSPVSLWSSSSSSSVQVLIGPFEPWLPSSFYLCQSLAAYRWIFAEGGNHISLWHIWQAGVRFHSQKEDNFLHHLVTRLFVSWRTSQ